MKNFDFFHKADKIQRYEQFQPNQFGCYDVNIIRLSVFLQDDRR